MGWLVFWSLRVLTKERVVGGSPVRSDKETGQDPSVRVRLVVKKVGNPVEDLRGFGRGTGGSSTSGVSLTNRLTQVNK